MSLGDPVLAILGDRHIDPIRHHTLLRRAVADCIDRIRRRILSRNPQAEKIDPIEIDRIVSGDAPGVDAFARRYGRLTQRHVAVYCADRDRCELLRQEGYETVNCSDWKINGNASGPIRNRKMLEKERPDVCLIDGGGPGSANVAKIAKELALNLYRYRLDDCHHGNELCDECDGLWIRDPDGEVL